MTSPADSYRSLVERVREISLLGSCAGLLGWDRETYMPPGGAEHRSAQLALLAGACHERFTDPVTGEMIAAVEGSEVVADPLSVEATNIRELRRSYDRETRLPKSLVEELSRTASLAYGHWVEARQASDFKRFEPWLDKVVKLKMQEADCLGHAGQRYDALLDDHEPGATAQWVASVLEPLRAELAGLLERIQGSSRRPRGEILHRRYARDAQEAFATRVAGELGFDFQAGRLDPTAHPFCCDIGPGDTRLTTRYNENDLGDAFFSVIHETGHGLYDQGLPREHWGLPAGEPVSLGIHESQSRLWENFVARSRPFWSHYLPVLAEHFPQSLAGVDLDAFVFAVNEVQPSLIRVDADEVTYNLHVIVRFEIETALLSGQMTAADVPAAWNEQYSRLLGITPPDDARGCLQDVHWSHGGIGYFPTYTLGNLNAAQLFAAAREKLGDLDGLIASGQFGPLLEFLRESIHRRGQQYRAPELIQVVTGKPLSHQALMDHLRTKYEELYGL